MFTLRTIAAPKSPDEAYKLLTSKKANTVIGGGGWLRLGHKFIDTGIDLSELGLDKIYIEADRIHIGAMVTLRELEVNPIIKSYFDGVLSKAVAHIIGVQFRNIATVGGTVFARFGFSDLLTALLTLDCTVHMHIAGDIPLEKFISQKRAKDICLGISLPIQNKRASFMRHDNSHGDFPIVNVAVSHGESGYKICVGARPSVAKTAQRASKIMNESGDMDAAIGAMANELSFHSNARASGIYRMEMAKVLLKRCIIEVQA